MLSDQNQSALDRDPTSQAGAESSTSTRWPALATTGVGSMPGTDVRESVAVVVGEVDVPHVVELPARGPGADMIGRTAALLGGVSADLSVQTIPTGWRLTSAPGRDVRRALAMLGEDLDLLEEAVSGLVGPLKLQLTGPWTLAAAVELASGERVLRDPGACRDLVDALAEVAAAQVLDVRRRVPGAQVWCQLDEPGLPAVLAGAVPSQSGWSRLRPVEPVHAAEALRAVASAVVAAGGQPMLHCCAARPPYDVIAESGARAVSIDLTVHDDRDDDATGALVDSGVALELGVIPVTGWPPDRARGPREPGPHGDGASDLGDTVSRVEHWRHRVGFGLDEVAPLLALSPTCGLAGATPARARSILEQLREVSRRLAQQEAPGDD